MKSPIVISPPEFERNSEVRQVKALLAEGMEVFHVRKPAATVNDLRIYLDAFTADEMRRMVLHSHHELHLEYPLRGLHGPGLNRRVDFSGSESGAWGADLPETGGLESGALEFTGTRSCSTHSWKAFTALPDGLDYAFLSPVFPSLSKEGYGPEDPESWEWKLIEKTFVQHAAKCIALGGVTPTNLEPLRQWGFDGFAVLGFIWNDAGGDPVSRYKRLEKTWNQALTH